MDLLPHQLMHLVHLGQLERALACDTIWQCVACETCTARCPQSVDRAAWGRIAPDGHRAGSGVEVTEADLVVSRGVSP